jgi:signal transduction histidine kinase
MVKTKKRELILYYIIYIVYFIIINIFPKSFVSHVGPILSLNYYPKPGSLYLFFGILYTIFVIYSIKLLYKDFKISGGLRKNQIKYLLLGVSVGFMGGAMTFLPVYGVEIYPIGTYLVIIYVVAITYAIVKYRLMDITIFALRGLIFFVVYGVLLALPLFTVFGLKPALEKISIGIYALLASAAPFVYIFLRKRTEDLIFKRQRHYQDILRNLAKSMLRIRDLKTLLDLVVHTMCKIVKVSFAGIYLTEENYSSFQLKSCYPEKEKRRFKEFIEPEHPLIRTLSSKKRYLFSEELPPQDKITLDSGLIIPFIIEDSLLGFLVIGAKPKQEMFTPDDLIVFETLSYSTSLAIENCRFWKQIEDRQRRARIEEMDIFSYSVAHEIHNPINTILNNTLYLKEYFLKYITDPEERKDIEEACNDTLEVTKRIIRIVEAVHEFGKKIDTKLRILTIEEVINSWLDFYSSQFKYHGIYFTQELPEKTPYIRGIKQELMHIFYNLSNNSIHALIGTKERKIHLKVELPNEDIIRISFSDNGYGIEKDLLPVIFNPFTTTKASTEGTGMGLHIVRQIIERHKGRIWAESEGRDKGATFFIELPQAKDITEEELKMREKEKEEEEGRRMF